MEIILRTRHTEDGEVRNKTGSSVTFKQSQQWFC